MTAIRLFCLLTVVLILPGASGQTPKANPRYPLPYPPRLPDGRVVVTESSPSFLKPSANLRDGVVIATTPPVVDFAFYPEQNYPGNPWSHRSDGIVVGDKYYSSSNDHLAPKGTAHLWEYDGRHKQFRLLVDTSRFLESVNAFPPGMNYRPGEMQSRIDLGSDGWLYYATDRGSPTVTHDQNGYLGEWILRTHPQARELLSREQMLKHPAVILHELAHAYHDQILTFEHPEVLAAYEKAKAAGTYENVLLYTGKKVKHYGLTNHKEYFAEGTEAFFYRNDFYPFVRAELKEHDPALHDALAKIWEGAKEGEKKGK